MRRVLNRLFLRTTPRYILAIIILSYFWMLGDVNSTGGVVLKMRELFGVNFPSLLQFACLISGATLLVGKRPTGDYWLLALPVFFYALIALLWYFETEGRPRSGFAVHGLVVFLIHWIIYQSEVVTNGHPNPNR